MKVGEYKSPNRALDYNLNRFKDNLKFIHFDEMKALEKLISISKLKNQAIILDLGAGTGRAIKFLLRANPKKIYAFDQSPAMLKLLEENYPNEIKKGLVKTIVGSSNKITLPKNTIDIVVSLHVFKHIKDINPTLKEVNRILNQDGFIIFDILNLNSIIRFNLGTCYALDKVYVYKTLEKNGFLVKSILPLHIFGETVYNFGGVKIIDLIDKFISRTGFPISTKFFILAQKYV